MIELAALDHLDDIPKELLSHNTRVYEAIEKISPTGARYHSMNAPDPRDLAKLVQKEAGKKSIQRYVRENYPDLVSRYKDSVLSGRRFEANQLIEIWAIEEIRRAFDRMFDPTSSKMQTRIIYQILVRHEWWS